MSISWLVDWLQKNNNQVTDYKSNCLTTQAKVVKRPFIRVPGLPSWVKKECFFEEAQELVTKFTISHKWAEDHSLLIKVPSITECTTITEKVHILPDRPPIFPPRVPSSTLAAKISGCHDK